MSERLKFRTVPERLQVLKQRRAGVPSEAVLAAAGPQPTAVGLALAASAGRTRIGGSA